MMGEGIGEVMAMAKRSAGKASRKPVDGYSKFRVRWRHVLVIDRRIRSGRPINCRMLAEELEVSRRTVLRDIDFMRCDLHAPVEFDPIENSYRYTEANWNLPNLRITEGDLFALMVAEKALDAYAGTVWAEKLQRVFDRIVSSLPDRIEIAPQDLVSRVSFGADALSAVDPEVLETLTQALRENRTVRMSYFVLQRNRVCDYQLDPYVLRKSHGAWYLAGRDHRTGHVPLFNLSRIRRMELSEERFDYEASGFDAGKYFQGTFGVLESSERHRAIIEFRGSASQIVREREWHPSQKVRTLSGDRIRFEVEVSHLWDVASWVLGWGSEAKVLAPKELVEMVAQQAKETAEVYRQSSKER